MPDGIKEIQKWMLEMQEFKGSVLSLVEQNKNMLEKIDKKIDIIDRRVRKNEIKIGVMTTKIAIFVSVGMTLLVLFLDKIL